MDETTFAALLRDESRKLYCVAYSILWNDADCADAMQEAAAKAWLRKGQLKHEEFASTWLYRILINECITLRRRRHVPIVPLDKAEGVALKDDVPDIDLKRSLARLPEKYRLPLILHHQDGYSLRETAEMLGLPEKRVRSRLHQARKMLKQLMGGEDHEA